MVISLGRVFGRMIGMRIPTATQNGTFFICNEIAVQQLFCGLRLRRCTHTFHSKAVQLLCRTIGLAYEHLTDTQIENGIA